MPLKAGVVQFSPLYGRLVENWGRLEALVREGVRQGAQLLVLPEMCWTGYLWPGPTTIRPWAEEAGSGPGQTRMADLAQDLGVWLVYGFPEREGPWLYNAQGVAAPGQPALPPYRKTHLFDADQWWAVPGNSGYRQWDSPWGPLGSGVCMDLNYPDLVEFHVRRRTEILAFSTNWIDQEFDVIPYWEACLAGFDDEAFRGHALFADRGGEEFGVRYRGQSAIFSDGRCVAHLPGKDDGVLVAELA